MKMNSDSGPPKIAFSFSRKPDAKLAPSVLIPDDKPTGPQIHRITSTADLTATAPGTDPANLIIPLIKRNTYAPLLAKPPPPPTLSPDDAAAAQAILQDLRNGETAPSQADDGVEIPLWMQNRLPAGFETDEKLDVGLRAEQATLEDYERIPVEAYGMAMLRGMGWKEEEGIGLRNKQNTKAVEAVVRPRGLGLGATPVKERKKGEKGEESERDEQEKVLKVGAYVAVMSGRYQSRTGRVTSMDNEAGRYVIALVGEEQRSVSIAATALQAISEREYTRSTRYINNDKYYAYKIVEDVAGMGRSSGKKEERRRRSRSREEEKKRRRRSRS